MIKWMSKYKRLSVSFGISLIFLILYVFNSPVLSNAGDDNIANYLVSDVKPGYYFISPFIAYPLKWLYFLMPKISWWVCFSIFSVWISVFIWCYCIDGIVNDTFLSIILNTIIISVFWFGICESKINFTQTAAVLSLSGMLLIWWNGHFVSVKRKIFYIIGTVFIMLGWFVRWKAVLLCLPFALSVGVWFVLHDLLNSLQESNMKGTCLNYNAVVWQAVKANFPTIGIIVCCMAAAVSLWGYGKLDKNWQEYYQANSLRESIYDYYKQYPQYSDNQDLYQKIGVNSSMMKMIHGNLTADKNHFNSDTLRKINALKHPNRITKSNISDVFKTYYEKPPCVITIIFLLLFLLFTRKKVVVPLLLQAGALLFCSAYLAYIGRTKWRVVICIVLAFLLCCIIITARAEFIQRKKAKLILIICYIIFVSSFLLLGVKKYHYKFPQAAVKNEEMHYALEYVNEHKENVYLMSGRNWRYYRVHTIWDSPEVGYCNNLVTYRAHFVLGQEEMLQRHGITDLFESLIENKNVLSQYDKLVHDYLIETYHPNITVSVIDIIKDNEIVRYMKPLDVTGDKIGLEEATAKIEYDSENNRLKIKIENEAGDKVQYLGISDAEENTFFTFDRLNDNDNIVFDIYIPDYIKENPNGFKAYLITEQEGKYIFYKDITKIFSSISGEL